MNRGFCRYAPIHWITATMLFATLMAACHQKEEKDEGVPAGITGINHTRTYIAAFYVDGTWGGNISSIQNGGGGGSNVCCIVLPRHHTPGLAATVRWNHTEDVDNWKEATAAIFPYPDGAGHVWINFLPDDRVVIVVSEMDTWSSNYFGDSRAPSHPGYRGWQIEFPKSEIQK